MSRTILIATAVVGMASAAHAQALPEAGPSAGEVAAWLQGEGLDVAVQNDAEAPRVSSGANGVSWDVVGYDCAAGRCRSWQFSAGFLLQAVNEGAAERWNINRRYARAFELDHAEGRAAVLQYDVMITPGMGWEAMTEHMRLFASLAPLYGLEVGAVREE